MYNSYEIVEAIQKKITYEHENGFEVQVILLSPELYEIMEFESDTGFIEELLGYPVQLDPNVKTFGFITYSVLN